MDSEPSGICIRAPTICSVSTEYFPVNLDLALHVLHNDLDLLETVINCSEKYLDEPEHLTPYVHDGPVNLALQLHVLYTRLDLLRFDIHSLEKYLSQLGALMHFLQYRTVSLALVGHIVYTCIHLLYIGIRSLKKVPTSSRTCYKKCTVQQNDAIVSVANIVSCSSSTVQYHTLFGESI